MTVIDTVDSPASTERKPAFVLPDGLPLLRSKQSRVQLVICKVVENLSMVLIGSRLDDHIREPVPEAAIFCIEGTRHDVPLAYLLEERTILGQRAPLKPLARAHSIDEPFRRLRDRPVDRGYKRIRLICTRHVVEEPGNVPLGSH